MATGEDFQKRCRWLAELAGWAVVFLAIAIVFEALWVAGVNRLFGESGADLRATINAVGVELVKSMPAFFLVCALRGAETVFSRMGKGVVLDATNAEGLAESGKWIEASAVASFVVTPSLLAWIAHEGGLRVDFEWITIALFLFGVVLTLLADVLRDAAAARAELDEIV